MPLGPHERSVRWHKRLPYWARPTFTTEVIGEKAAYEEPEIQRAMRLANMPQTDVNHQYRLPLAGGPLDGGGFRVPSMALKGGTSAPPFEVSIIVPAEESKVLLPDGVHRPRRRAVYLLDRSAPPTLRFVRIETL